MRKVDGKFVLSATDKKKAEAHTRALARRLSGQGNDGFAECWFDSSRGEFRYLELYNGEFVAEPAPDMQFVCRKSIYPYYTI